MICMIWRLKLKKALNRRRNEKKRNYLDSMDKNKINLQKLQEYLDKIEQHIKGLEKDGQHLAHLYNYSDLERDDDVEAKVRKDVS